jgi:hypothetical protein
MESTDTNGQAGSEEWAGKVDRTWKLVRLHANQADQRAAALLTNHTNNAVGPHPPIGLIVSVQANFNIRSQYLTPACVFGKCVEAGQCV